MDMPGPKNSENFQNHAGEISFPEYLKEQIEHITLGVISVLNINKILIGDDFFEGTMLSSQKPDIVSSDNLRAGKEDNKKYDLIFTSKNFMPQPDHDLKHYLSKASSDCIICGIFPTFRLMKSKSNKSVRSTLEGNGFFVNSIIGLPKLNGTALNVSLMWASRQKTLFEYISVMEDERGFEHQEEILIDRITDSFFQTEEFFDRQHEEQEASGELDLFLMDEENNLELAAELQDLHHGIDIPAGEFKGFSYHQSKLEIDRLKTDYKSYRSEILGNLSIEINLSRTSFEEKDNSIYIPMIGTQKVTCDIGSLSLKTQNICQVVLDSKSISNKYAETYFNSVIGQKFIASSCALRGYIPRLTKHDIYELDIAVPDKSTQEKIANTDSDLTCIIKALSEIKKSLSINPMSSDKILKRIRKIYESVFIADKLVKLKADIHAGESSLVEFKETFKLDIKTKELNKGLVQPVIKNIAGFMNSKGGVIYIGVKDHPILVTSVSEELEKFHKNNKDSYTKTFADSIRKDFGKIPSYIDYEFIEHENGPVFAIFVKKSPKPQYINDAFYVRGNPKVEELKAQELVDYVREHFEEG
jgi:hypothetical protein